MTDYYNLLGIAPDAGAEEIKRAFRARAKEVHPDARPHLSGAEREACNRRFILLAQAYETLSDPARRETYHRRWLAEQRARTAAKATGSAGSARARPGSAAEWKGARTTFRGGRRPAGSGARPADDGADSMEEMLRDAEALLSRFGLSLRQPFEELLEALLAWAREVFRQVSEALGDTGQRQKSAGSSRPREGPRKGATAGARSASGGRAARPDPAARARAESEAVEAELRALKERLRKGR